MKTMTWTATLLFAASLPAVSQTKLGDDLAAIFARGDLDGDLCLSLDEVRSATRDYVRRILAILADETRLAEMGMELAPPLPLDAFLAADRDDDHWLCQQELRRYLENPTGELTPYDCEVLGEETLELEWDWLLAVGDDDHDRHFDRDEWLGSEQSSEDVADFELCDEDGDGRLDKREATACTIRGLRRDQGYAPAIGTRADGTPVVGRLAPGFWWVVRVRFAADANDGREFLVRWEVLAVEGRWVTYRCCPLDLRGKPAEGAVFEATIELRREFAGLGSRRGCQRETLELLGRNWSCWVREIGPAGAHSWDSVDYPLLNLRTVTPNLVQELVSFGEGGP